MLNYQALTPPRDLAFELTSLFRAHGIAKPSHRQFTYLRHRLTDLGFVRERVQGLCEYWIDEKISRNNDPESKRIYTINSFISMYFPGVLPINEANRSLENIAKINQFHKIMRSRGLRPRHNYEYWSYKMQKRQYTKRPLPKPSNPKHIRVPPGAFNVTNLLDANAMRLTPENYQWAQNYLRAKGALKIAGTSKYALPNVRGSLPAQITGQWQLPGPAFTTYQFQLLNNARRPSKEDWQRALAFLYQSGYTFDPSWKRWRKA